MRVLSVFLLFVFDLLKIKMKKIQLFESKDVEILLFQNLCFVTMIG